jgi:hypothetical protein
MDAGSDPRAALRRIQNCRKLAWIFLLAMVSLNHSTSFLKFARN